MYLGLKHTSRSCIFSNRGLVGILQLSRHQKRWHLSPVRARACVFSVPVISRTLSNCPLLLTCTSLPTSTFIVHHRRLLSHTLITLLSSTYSHHITLITYSHPHTHTPPHAPHPLLHTPQSPVFRSVLVSRVTWLDSRTCYSPPAPKLPVTWSNCGTSLLWNGP